MKNKRKTIAVGTVVYEDQWALIPVKKAAFVREAIDKHLEDYGIFVKHDAVKNLEEVK